MHQLRNDKKCPACENRLTDIGQAFCRDTTLQAFVYKYVPETFLKEIKQRTDFIKKRLPTEEERAMLADWSITDFGQYLCLKDEMISFSIEYVSREQILNHNKNQFLPSTSADSEEKSPKKNDFRSYFRCPAGVKIKHLKMLLEGKLEIPDNYVLYFIELETEDIVEENYTLQDLVYIFGWNRLKPLRIYFTLARLMPEEDKPPVLEVQLADQTEVPDSGPPQLECAEMPSLVGSALTVNLSTAMFEKDSNRNSPNGLLPRMPIITTTRDGPPKKKRKREPKKEKPSHLPLNAAAKHSPPTSAAHPSHLPDFQLDTPKNSSPTIWPLAKSPPIAISDLKGQSPNISDSYQFTPPESSASTPVVKSSTSPTLLTVEQSNKQLNHVFAPINSAPNTPLPLDDPPTLAVERQKSADAFYRQRIIDAMSNGTFKIQKNSFIVQKQPSFLTMPQSTIIP